MPRDSRIERIGLRSRDASGVGVLAALEGAALVLWHLAATPFIGRRRLQWGTQGTEAASALPGDELVPDPKWSYTHAVGIDATPDEVWSWIAQIGQSRGGFYSYESLENLFGCRITNATEILDEYQHPAVGDPIHLHPETPPLRIEIVEPPNAFVLVGSPADVGGGASWGRSTWQFVIEPLGGEACRLLTRGRYDHSPDWKSRLMLGRFPLEAISFVMSRKMMLEIKRLAEQTRIAP